MVRRGKPLPSLLVEGASRHENPARGDAVPTTDGGEPVPHPVLTQPRQGIREDVLSGRYPGRDVHVTQAGPVASSLAYEVEVVLDEGRTGPERELVARTRLGRRGWSRDALDRGV